MKDEKAKNEGGRMRDEERQVVRQDLKKRTRVFAIEIVRLYSSLPKSTEAQVLGRQLLRTGTSVGAQYAESQRAKSNKDLINKVEGALQEAEEVLYWLDLLAEMKFGNLDKLTELSREANELISIFVTIVRKVKRL